MCNKVKLGQHFAVISAKRVTVFQASLKLVTERPEPNSCDIVNKNSTSQGSKCLCEKGHYKYKRWFKLRDDRMI